MIHQSNDALAWECLGVDPIAERLRPGFCRTIAEPQDNFLAYLISEYRRAQQANLVRGRVTGRIDDLSHASDGVECSRLDRPLIFDRQNALQ